MPDTSLPAPPPAPATTWTVTREQLIEALQSNPVHLVWNQTAEGYPGTPEMADAILAQLTPGEPRPGMFEQVYMDIQKFLDEALGPDEEDGAGAGLEGDVRLLAAQRDEARRLLAAAAAGGGVPSAPATVCCDLHGRTCEPPSELCCERCTEAHHDRWTWAGVPRFGHPGGEVCSNPDLSASAPATGGDQ